MKKPRSRQLVPTKPPALATTDPQLLAELRQLIESARLRTAQAVNSELALLHWQIGRRIREEILREERAPYGKQIVSALGSQLSAEYGRGFGQRNLFNMIRFAEAFPDERIVSTLWRQLGWSHFKEIIYLDKPLQRDFYAEMCKWGHDDYSLQVENLPQAPPAALTSSPSPKGRGAENGGQLPLFDGADE